MSLIFFFRPSSFRGESKGFAFCILAIKRLLCDLWKMNICAPLFAHLLNDETSLN